MKPLFYLLFVSFISQYVFSQSINNGDFENWETTPHDLTVPIGWKSEDLSSINKSDESVSGDNSLLISSWYNVFAGFVVYGDTIHDTLGNFGNFPDWKKSGLPNTDRIQSIKGSYKYTDLDTDSDSAFIKSVLRKSNGVGGYDIIASAEFYFTKADDWTDFELPFEYFSNDTPDTLSIMIASFTQAQFWSSETYPHKLSIDNLTVSNETVSTKSTESNHLYHIVNGNSLEIYNPEVGEFVILYNVLGKEVLSGEMLYSYNQFDISELNKGVYILVVGNYRKKIIIQK